MPLSRYFFHFPIWPDTKKVRVTVRTLSRVTDHSSTSSFINVDAAVSHGIHAHSATFHLDIEDPKEVSLLFTFDEPASVHEHWYNYNSNKKTWECKEIKSELGVSEPHPFNLPHEPGMERCTVSHPPGQGQCVRCKRCGDFIVPAEMKSPCRARKNEAVQVVEQFKQPVSWSTPAPSDVGLKFVGGGKATCDHRSQCGICATEFDNLLMSKQEYVVKWATTLLELLVADQETTLQVLEANPELRQELIKVFHLKG